MNPSKAIKVLTILKSQTQPGAEQDELDALQLGIEALERLERGRKVDHAFACARLPGETKD